MSFNELYNKAYSNTLDINMLITFLSAKKNELLQANRFKRLYNLLKTFQINNRNDLIDCFLEFINGLPRNCYQDLFNFIFDENKRSEALFNDLLGNTFGLKVDTYNIILDELNKYSCDRSRYRNMFEDYYFQITDSENEDYLDGVKFQYINPKHLYYLYSDNPDYFKEKLFAYLDKNPDITIEFWRFKKELYTEFKSYAHRITYKGITFEEVIYLDKLLKDTLNYENGFSFTNDSYLQLWSYYKKGNILPSRVLELLFNSLDKSVTMDYSDPNISEIKITIDTIKFISDIIAKTRTTNKEAKIIIPSDIAEANYEILANLKDVDNIFVDFGGIDNDGKISLIEYIRSHKFYDATAELVERFDFSPFEKYIYAYYLTTILRRYRYYRDDKDTDQSYSNLSRDKYFIIYGDYIVCAGYVNYIVNLLKKVGFDASSLSVRPPETLEAHARVLTHIQDEKYGIDGVYIGDPTFDSEVGLSFLYAFMTKSKDSYDKYQRQHDSEFEFYTAMKDLGLNDNLCSPVSEEFFDIINREIPNEKIVKALHCVFEKLHPEFSDDELDEYVYGITSVSQIPYIPNSYLDKKCSDIKNSMSFNALVNNPNITFMSSISRNDGEHMSYEFIFELNGWDNKVLLDNLKVSSIADDIVDFGYSHYHKKPVITFNLDPSCTVREFGNIINATINKILRYFNMDDEKVDKDESLSTSTSLISIATNNNDIVWALFDTSSSSREDNIINLFINNKISIYEISLLIKWGKIDKDVLLGKCMEHNIELGEISSLRV